MRKLAAIALVLAVCAAAAALVPIGAGGAAPAARGAKPAAHTITLVNNTDETIWPAAWPGSTSGRTGWTLPAGASLTELPFSRE